MSNMFKKLIGGQKKKRRTKDDDEGATTAAGEGGGGPMRFKEKKGKNSAKEKKAASAEQKKKGDAAGATVADAAAPPADAKGAVRTKTSQDKKKNDKNEATCMLQPDTDPPKDKSVMPNDVKDFKDKDGIIDPEKDARSIEGRDPEAMTEAQLKNLKGFLAQYEAVGVKGLIDEFESIKNYNITPFDHTTHELNPTKNRYKDIFCIEPSRVKLVDGKEGDYVHANYVKGDPFLNKFVTTQGPIPATVNDFWRLVVQENIGYIFMLCSIVELGKKKCELYYPDNLKETITYGDIIVTLVDKREDAHFINSKLILEAPGQPKRYVYHNYWKNWPDRGVPLTCLAGIRLLRHARTTNYGSIVHCSAGVGRTGTLVALEWLLQTICLKPPPYDMKEMLKVLRNQRAHAIQTAPQYAYIAFAVFRLMALKESSFIPQFMKWSQDMQTHTGVKIDGGPMAGAAPSPGVPPGP